MHTLGRPLQDTDVSCADGQVICNNSELELASEDWVSVSLGAGLMGKLAEVPFGASSLQEVLTWLRGLLGVLVPIGVSRIMSLGKLA